MSGRPVEPFDVARMVEEYENRTPLDESGVYLHTELRRTYQEPALKNRSQA